MASRDLRSASPPAGRTTAADHFSDELAKFVNVADLSLRDLADVTHDSKSQWQRWLAGKSDPPRRAVKELAKYLAAHEITADRLLDLWDDAFGAGQPLPGQEAARLPGQEAVRLPSPQAVRPASPRAVPPDAQASATERAAGRLADEVARECATELNDRVLQGWDPLIVSWRPCADQDGGPASGSEAPAGDTGDVAPLTRHVRCGHGLVVLGPGEAGKTTLATFLMNDLLANRESADPIPVLLQASSLREGETVTDWLRRTLADRHPSLRDTRAYGPDAVGGLLDARLVLPVIDGLDDLAPAAGARLLKDLRRAFARGQPLIVTCQPTEYHRAVAASGRVLADAAVIELRPVAAEDAARFLSRGASGDHARNWELLTAKILAEPDGPIARALSSPLMTGLLRSAYADDTGIVAELTACDDLAAIENRIIDALFVTTFSARATSQSTRPRRPWNPASADCWLTFLATHLARCRSHDLDWPRLRQALPAFATPVGWAALGALLAWLLAGTAFGLSWLAHGGGQAVLYGLAQGLDAACVVGALYLLADLSYPPGPALPSWLRWLQWLRGRTRDPLALAAVVPAAYAIESGLRDGIGVGMRHGTATGVRVGLTALALNWLIASAVIFLAARNKLVQFADNPVYFSLRVPGRVAGFAKTIAAGLALGSALGLGAGYCVKISSGLLAGEHPCWQLGALAGAVFGAAFALVRWGRTPAESALAASPGAALRTDRTLVLLLAAVFLVMVPIIFAAAFPGRFAQYALYGLGIGITVWLAIALSHAWPQYLITAAWLAARGRLPLRLASFLDEAHRLEILRQRDGAYQFRHARLRDHLADERQ